MQRRVFVSDTASHPPELQENPFPGMDLPEIRGSILVVEDESFVLEVTGEILEAAGYHVLTARSAAEAMKAFEQADRRVELLVTDVVLPGRNGRDLARDLKAVCPPLKVIFVSGYPENAVTRSTSNLCGTIYLAKPFSVGSLMQKVKEALTDPALPQD